MATAHEDLQRVASDLLTADDEGDQVALTRIAWDLLGQVAVAAAEIDRLHAALWTSVRECPPGAAQNPRTRRRWHVLVPGRHGRPLTPVLA